VLKNTVGLSALQANPTAGVPIQSRWFRNLPTLFYPFQLSPEGVWKHLHKMFPRAVLHKGFAKPDSTNNQKENHPATGERPFPSVE
jgi:hypothetical protein